MSRRTLTLLLASVLALILTGAAVAAPVPYVALGPGPTFNTLGDVKIGKVTEPVITIEGRKTFPVDGHLDLTTVGVNPDLTLLQALRGWFDRDLAVVPRDVVYPPGRTDAQVDAENAASMRQSQSSAALAAARQLGFPIARVTVKDFSPNSPAAGRLEAGDVLTTLDGTRLRDAADLRALVGGGKVGQIRRIGYLRKGAPGSVEVTTGRSGGDGEKRPVIGVLTAEEPVALPFTVEISLEEVGGPSAGLMFALGIVDKLNSLSLTAGKYIAGTGEITAEGTVGPIGGITQKLIAARAKGAVAFLVPAANCKEAALRPPAGLTLVKVSSLSTALDGLAALRSGAAPASCTG